MTTPSRKPSIKLIDGKATTTSLEIAKHFGKEHCRVLRSIENLECSKEFHAANFGVMSNTIEVGSGAKRQQKTYSITKDGFMFLAMGFTGKEAAQWKEKFIEAFNALELRVNQRATSGKPVAKALPNLDKKRYNYPRKLLEQAWFTTPERRASLNLSMLVSQNFSSPLMSLLADLETDGHDVSGPKDELIALREALVRSDEAFKEIWETALAAQHMPASTAKD